MANVQRVINLIRTDDANVMLSCFNNSSTTSKNKLYHSWLDFIKFKLGNCCFTGDTCALHMFNEDWHTLPHPVSSAEEVISLITECFDAPETFRLELITKYNTTFTWLFVLASDLQIESK